MRDLTKFGERSRLRHYASAWTRTWWATRDETANWVLRAPRARASETAEWVERAEALLATASSCSAVAAEMGYRSAKAFSKLFKQRTGHAPRDTKMENNTRSDTCRRAAQARLLLIAGNHTVGQIVELAGFNSRQGLDKAFKRIYGMPPAAWIKWYRDISSQTSSE